jgi:hypothetical protein
VESSITLDSICTPSEDVVAREIEGELIIVPLVSGVGDTDDELYTLNPTGHAIWQKLDGKRTLREIAGLLSNEYDAPAAELEKDVLGLANELVRRRILSVAGAS